MAKANNVNTEVTVTEEELTAMHEAAIQENADRTTVVEEAEERPASLINQLFVDQAEAVSNRGHQLNHTAELTKSATLAMADIMRQIGALKPTDDNYEHIASLVEASRTSHDMMDDLISELFNVGGIDRSYLENMSEEELEKMLRSQQSKRSRAKSKVMDQQNYQTMMVAAIAETVVRLAANKPKNSGGAALGDLGVTDEDFEKLRDDAEELKKAIRNVQSKKSIMKSKNGFTEEHPRWKQLCELEARLKELRDETTVPVSVQERRDAKAKAEAEEMLKDIDLSTIEDDQAKALLEKLSEVLATKQTEEDGE